MAPPRTPCERALAPLTQALPPRTIYSQLLTQFCNYLSPHTHHIFITMDDKHTITAACLRAQHHAYNKILEESTTTLMLFHGIRDLSRLEEGWLEGAIEELQKSMREVVKEYFTKSEAAA